MHHKNQPKFKLLISVKRSLDMKKHTQISDPIQQTVGFQVKSHKTLQKPIFFKTRLFKSHFSQFKNLQRAYESQLPSLLILAGVVR